MVPHARLKRDKMDNTHTVTHLFREQLRGPQTCLKFALVSSDMWLFLKHREGFRPCVFCFSLASLALAGWWLSASPAGGIEVVADKALAIAEAMFLAGDDVTKLLKRRALATHRALIPVFLPPGPRYGVGRSSDSVRP